MFEIALANPIKFVENTGGRLDTHFSVDLINSFQDKKCYFQKWQRDDQTRLQILSDHSDISFTIHDLYTDAVVLTIIPIDMEVNVIGQSFRVYEVPIDFSQLIEGEYYAVISYTNDLEQDISIYSEPMMVRDEHDSTLLIQYRNSDNNFSIVFDTDIVFTIRVEGVIDQFTPQSDDVVYNDQKRNATLLSSIPYRSYTLFIGHAEGIANWMADKINRAMACDMVMIDGDYYEKTEGASWEVNRADAYAFLGMTLEIMPVENRFLNRLKTGKEPGEVTIVQKISNYNDISGDMAVVGKFRENTLLEKICIIRTGPAFNFLVGTTEGGSEIGEFQITDLVTTLNINWLFTAERTLYLSGVTEVSFLSLIYKQLDEPPIPTGIGGTPNPYASLGKGAMVIYHEINEGDLDRDFSVSTGLGNPDTQWEGWAISDGRNSTIDMGGVFPLGYKAGTNQPGDTGGVSEIKITTANLPAHVHHTVVDGSAPTPNLQAHNSIAKNRTSGGNSNANLGGILSEPTLGKTSNAGVPPEDQHPINIMNPYRVVIWVTKIAE